MAAIVEETELMTDRLRLRTYRDPDAQVFFNLIRDNALRLAPAFPSRVLVTEQFSEAQRLMKRFKSDWMLGQMYAFGIWRQDTKQYIGDISLKNFDYSVPKAEIAYYLEATAEAQGFGTEALQAIIKFAFYRLEVYKLYIRCALGNCRSYSMAERCGFRREGLMRQDFRDHQKQLVDIYYYGLIRSDFEQQLPSS